MKADSVAVDLRTNQPTRTVNRYSGLPSTPTIIIIIIIIIVRYLARKLLFMVTVTTYILKNLAKAASPVFHPSSRQMHSSTACAGQAHSPMAAVEQCAMHVLMRRYVTTGWHVSPSKLPLSIPSIRRSLDHTIESASQTASRSVQPFFAQLTCVHNTQTHRRRPRYVRHL